MIDRLYVNGEPGQYSLYRNARRDGQRPPFLKTILSEWVRVSFILFAFRKSEKKFHLYYYDGLARQDEEIKLTIGRVPKVYLLSDVFLKCLSPQKNAFHSMILCTCRKVLLLFGKPSPSKSLF